MFENPNAFSLCNEAMTGRAANGEWFYLRVCALFLSFQALVSRVWCLSMVSCISMHLALAT